MSMDTSEEVSRANSMDILTMIADEMEITQIDSGNDFCRKMDNDSRDKTDAQPPTPSYMGYYSEWRE